MTKTNDQVRDTAAPREPTVNLKHRLEVLTASLQALESDPARSEDVRSLVAAIRASSVQRGMTQLADAARRTEAASDTELVARVRDLAAVMRQELDARGPEALCVMIVSADPELLSALGAALGALGRAVLPAATAGQAIELLASRAIAFVVVDFMLNGEDGRALIAALRSNTATAGIPVAAITPAHASLARDHDLMPPPEGYFEKPVNAEEVAAFLSDRLKRGRARHHESRRDPLTGLLNRAAFIETYVELAAQHAARREPMVLALLGINGYSDLAEELGAEACDAMIRQLGANLSSAFRSTDVVGRWGLSEFAVILPGEDNFGGTRALEKVTALLGRQCVASPAGRNVSLSVSAGVSVVTGNPPWEEAVEAAARFLHGAYLAGAGPAPVAAVVSDASRANRRPERIAFCLAKPDEGRPLAGQLDPGGYETVMFATEEAALRDLSRVSVSMLVLDDEWPGEGAFRLLQAVRAMPQHARLPILMLVSGEASVVRALELGANDYVLRSTPPLGFAARVRRVLRQHAEDRSRDRPTVLIVDHEVPQLLVAGTALHQQGGCHVVLARGARDGLRRIVDVMPDILVLDMHMPDFSGSDFLKRIPLLPRLRRMAIVMGSDSPQASLSGDTFKVLGRVTRPYKPATFLTEVRAWVPPPATKAAGTNPGAIDGEIQRVLTLSA